MEPTRRKGSDTGTGPSCGVDGGVGGASGGDLEDRGAEGFVGHGSAGEHGGEESDLEEEGGGEEDRAGEEEEEGDGGEGDGVFASLDAVLVGWLVGRLVGFVFEWDGMGIGLEEVMLCLTLKLGSIR
mmetsp:Transcript_21459/g.45128  ORF Transcript_21459/g.45128 Transcript_21459/m.45128 type:complete len:127 (-) Transcript_21459:115-495(-)